jgi:hypothetical protein
MTKGFPDRLAIVRVYSLDAVVQKRIQIGSLLTEFLPVLAVFWSTDSQLRKASRKHPGTTHAD